MVCSQNVDCFGNCTNALTTVVSSSFFDPLSNNKYKQIPAIERVAKEVASYQAIPR